MDEALDKLVNIDLQLRQIDLAKVALSYDHESDTLMIHFAGRGRSATSVELSEDVYLRWDRAKEQAVGVQLEHFLSRFVFEHPDSIDLLDIADVRGITDEEIAIARKNVARLRKKDLIERAIRGTYSTAAD